ncbi:hypothetical protein B0H11DRAFT_1968345, partial [Mycena galericulata]
ERLPALPKLDKTQFIASYLQGQKVHAKSHAEEGRSVTASWHRHSTPEKPSANVGFATPILTARVSRGAQVAENKSSRQDPEVNLQTAKKRRGDSDHDEDQAARLLERRERKRAKRAIVQAKGPSEPDAASSNGDKKKMKAKGKKPKVPSGFALMHGFSATNVGKNRLTLKPPSNVGVFKKGKASLNTKTKPKPTVKPFSELGFLNNTKKIPEPVASDTSSSSDNESSAEDMPDLQKKKIATQQSRPAKVPRILTDSSQHASELSKIGAPQKCNPAQSEIWDIESRASEKQKAMKRNTCAADDADASYVQGTVVVDARKPAWCDRGPTQLDPVVQITLEREVPDVTAIPSSPSLRPSQSASQVGHFHSKQTATIPKPEHTKPTCALVPESQPIENEQESDPPTVSVSAPLVTRFIMPARNRVFANRFPLVQPFSPQSQDPDLYRYAAEAERADFQGSDHYTGVPDSPERLEMDYSPDEEAPGCQTIADESLADHPQPGDYVYPQSPASWDADDADVMCGPWTDTHEDVELDEFPIPYVDAYGDLGFIGGRCPEDSNAYSESGGSVDYYQADTFMDATGDTVPYIGSDAWEEATVNSMYLNDCFQDDRDGLAWGGDDFTEDHNGQTLASSAIDFGVTGDLEDIISECSEAPSAYTPRFAQGRALLMGLPVQESTNLVLRATHAPQHISHAEKDVAKALRHHWFRQRL